jgi:hypothetical protein
MTLLSFGAYRSPAAPVNSSPFLWSRGSDWGLCFSSRGVSGFGFLRETTSPRGSFPLRIRILHRGPNGCGGASLSIRFFWRELEIGLLFGRDYERFRRARISEVVVGDVRQFLTVSLRYFLPNLAGIKPKEIRVFRGYDACSTNRNLGGRVAAGVVVACTSPQSSTGNQHDDYEYRQFHQSEVKTTIRLCECIFFCLKML